MKIKQLSYEDLMDLAIEKPSWYQYHFSFTKDDIFRVFKINPKLAVEIFFKTFFTNKTPPGDYPEFCKIHYMYDLFSGWSTYNSKYDGTEDIGKTIVLPENMSIAFLNNFSKYYKSKGYDSIEKIPIIPDVKYLDDERVSMYPNAKKLLFYCLRDFSNYDSFIDRFTDNAFRIFIRAVANMGSTYRNRLFLSKKFLDRCYILYNADTSDSVFRSDLRFIIENAYNYISVRDTNPYLLTAECIRICKKILRKNPVISYHESCIQYILKSGLIKEVTPNIDVASSSFKPDLRMY